MDKVRSVCATRVIPATPATIFSLLADPSQHARFDGSQTVLRVRRAPKRLSLGANFSMHMKIWNRYFIRNKVVVFEENKSIAWLHFTQYVWRYDLEEVPGGTRVTETFTYDKPWAFTIIALHWPEKNRLAMEATLARIEHLATA